MKYFLLACCILLASCYAPVPITLYKDSYRDRHIDEEGEENEFAIVTKGNAQTSMERVSDYAILRAAQIMKQEDFEYFSISKEVKDYNVDKVLHTQITYGAAATGVVDVRNPVVGLLVIGHNEKPTLENKRQKVYKTSDVLEEFNHYIDEVRPKEFDAATTVVNTLYVGLIGISVYAIFWALTI